MKVVPAVIAEVKRIREIFLDHHGVPISQEFVDFANAIGNLCDAAVALALASAAVDVPVEDQGKPDARPATEEKAWLIERRQHGPVEYLTGETSGYFPSWDADSLLAIRFCRREDAERIAGIFDDLDIHICEHAWGLYEPDARPVIGPNTHRGEDGSVSVLGTSTGIDARPVTDEQKRECVEWLKGYMLSRVYKALSGNAEEIVTYILNRLAPTAGRDK